MAMAYTSVFCACDKDADGDAPYVGPNGGGDRAHIVGAGGHDG